MSLASIRIAARLLVVAGLAALTAGCFQPMYAEHTDGTPGLREKLMGVEVPPVDKPNASQEARIQVEIRNALAFKLYGNATGMPPTHRLVLKFTTSRSSLMIDPAAAFRPLARFPGCRGSRRPGDRRKNPDPAGVVLRRRHLIPSVIPGRAKREPGISINYIWIPGPREGACPGMTTKV